MDHDPHHCTVCRQRPDAPTSTKVQKSPRPAAATTRPSTETTAAAAAAGAPESPDMKQRFTALASLFKSKVEAGLEVAQQGLKEAKEKASEKLSEAKLKAAEAKQRAASGLAGGLSSLESKLSELKSKSSNDHHSSNGSGTGGGDAAEKGSAPTSPRRPPSSTTTSTTPNSIAGSGGRFSFASPLDRLLKTFEGARDSEGDRPRRAAALQSTPEEPLGADSSLFAIDEDEVDELAAPLAPSSPLPPLPATVTPALRVLQPGESVPKGTVFDVQRWMADPGCAFFPGRKMGPEGELAPRYALAAVACVRARFVIRVVQLIGMWW